MTDAAHAPEAPDAARAERELIACPICDRLHEIGTIPEGGRIRCRRCDAVLMTNRPRALDRTLAAAFGSVILMVAAVFFPFLELSAVGLHRRASVLDAALAFSSGFMVPLSIAVALLIVVIPLTRAGAMAYAILPLRLDRRPARHAEAALRLAGRLKPWAMAEIFIIGVVVALVKVGDIASITLGPAFWALVFLVVLVVYENGSLCMWSVWRTLERLRPA